MIVVVMRAAVVAVLHVRAPVVRSVSRATERRDERGLGGCRGDGGVEMGRSGKQTFCCGAGGAHMWMEERAKPINEERVREAAATGADTLAVACPFCTVMLDDGVQSAGADLRVADVATLLSEALDDGAR